MMRGLAAGACGAAALGALALWLSRPAAPPFAAVRAAHASSDARLLDRHGVMLDARRIDLVRRRLDWVPLAAVSPALGAAIVAAEDRRFAEHDGIDGRAIAAALRQSAVGGSVRGASTITMQLAALLDPRLRPRGGSRTLAQKWAQARLARALERAWSKDQILEAYVNLVDFRGDLSGVGAAAAALFGTTPDALSAAEAVVLAALVAAPSAAPAAVARRARMVCTMLAEPPAAVVVDATTARALARTPSLPPPHSMAPHLARRLLREPGDVWTTIDARLQRAAIAALERNLLAVCDRGVQDGAVLVVDNDSGDVLAYVGSSGLLSAAAQVDGVRARRQAGSTLKPFLYGVAMERRLLTPASLIEDGPLEVVLPSGLYRPHNYDDRFRGLVSVRTALAASLNTPAVRTLGLVGGDAFLARLHGLGLSGLDRDAGFYGPALALGSADVSPWELVGAYRTIATGGWWTPLRLRPDEPPVEARRVFEPATAFLIADVLADRESRSTTFGLENALATRFWAAVKTGTSTDMRDNWCVGFSRRYTVGVWVGNFSGAPMRDVSGVTGAAPVWLELMERLHRGLPSEPPVPPPGVVATPVAFPDDVEPPRREWALAGSETSGRSLRAPERPRIVAPLSGSRIALDPDMPRERQRVLLHSEGADGTSRWRMDGADLAPATARWLWEPRPGRHLLELVDADGTVLDHAELDVHGPASR